MRMFSERGFGGVTVEEIAEVAEVSPSTIYRYFSTKEGLLVRDEYDDEMQAALVAALGADGNPYAALLGVLRSHPPEMWAVLTEITRARAEVVYADAALTRATDALVKEWVTTFTTVLADAGRDEMTARVMSAALSWGLMAGIEQWWLDGGSDDLRGYMIRAVETVGRIGTD